MPSKDTQFKAVLTIPDSEVADLYRSGKSIAQVAEQLSVSSGTISRALKRAGIKPRHKNHEIQESIATKGQCFYDYEAIASAYASGLSMPKVAEQFGCTMPTVVRALRKTGTPSRSLSDGKSLAHRGNKGKVNGYTTVTADKYARKLEHILIAEAALGRKLKKGECVHHINQNRSDNRRENLLICTIGYHTAIHARMRKHPEWSKTKEV